jgi:hypothetical protein
MDNGVLVNYWEDFLVEDLRALIFDSLPMTPQLCMARTCKGEWARLGMDNVRYLHLALASDVVQGRTPLAMVKAWMIGLKKIIGSDLKKRPLWRLCHASMSLAEALASEGWPHDTIVDLCCKSDEVTNGKHLLNKYRITFHERHITCDILRGYIRGNHVQLFTERWKWFVDRKILAWPRPVGLFLGRLYMFAASMGRRDIMPHLIAHSPAKYHIPHDPDIMFRGIKSMVKAVWAFGQFEWFIEIVQSSVALPREGAEPLPLEIRSLKKLLFFGFEKNDKTPSWIMGKFVKYMETVVVFDHRFVDYILLYFPTFLDMYKKTCSWTKLVWGRGRLEDLQWLQNHNLLTFHSFRETVIDPIWAAMTTIRNGTPWPRRRYQQWARYAKAFRLAEQYLVKSPVTEYLRTLGYYRLVLAGIKEGPNIPFFSENLRPDMREWFRICDNPDKPFFCV